MRAGSRFGFPPATHSYTLRDLFFVKYEVDGNGAQADLPLHQDGSLVSFNILLNPATDFEGGGTFFEATATTYLIEQGDALFHCGGLRHAAAPITSGRCRSCLCLSLHLPLCDKRSTAVAPRPEEAQRESSMC